MNKLKEWLKREIKEMDGIIKEKIEDEEERFACMIRSGEFNTYHFPEERLMHLMIKRDAFAKVLEEIEIIETVKND